MENIDYKKAYFHLFNQMTDILETISLLEEKIKSAQIAAEEIIISSEDSNEGDVPGPKSVIKTLEGVA